MSREKIYLRVVPGSLIPADEYARSRLRERGYRAGDLLKADLTKPNNPRFHRLLHYIGRLCAENIEAFAGMDAHQVLKRIQFDGDIACEELGVSLRSAWRHVAKAILALPGMGSMDAALRVIGELLPDSAVIKMRIPRSLSFDSMDDGERHEVARAMCRHISEQHWPAMEPEAIERMAEAMIQEAA